jgi:hypothetical protein
LIFQMVPVMWALISVAIKAPAGRSPKKDAVRVYTTDGVRARDVCV